MTQAHYKYLVKLNEKYFRKQFPYVPQEHGTVREYNAFIREKATTVERAEESKEVWQHTSVGGNRFLPIDGSFKFPYSLSALRNAHGWLEADSKILVRWMIDHTSNVVGAFGGSPRTRLRRGHWYDWIKYSNQFHPRMSVEETIQLAAQWTGTDTQSKQKNDPTGKHIRNLEDGHVLVQLITEEQLNHESEQMQHCVRHYGVRLKEGSSKIYSLRKDGKSLATIELGMQEMSIRQIYGFKNSILTSYLQDILSPWAYKYLNFRSFPYMPDVKFTKGMMHRVLKTWANWGRWITTDPTLRDHPALYNRVLNHFTEAMSKLHDHGSPDVMQYTYDHYLAYIPDVSTVAYIVESGIYNNPHTPEHIKQQLRHKCTNAEYQEYLDTSLKIWVQAEQLLGDFDIGTDTGTEDNHALA